MYPTSSVKYTQRVDKENLHYFGVYTAAMGFTSDACWFLLMKTLLIKNNKKREAALKNEAGGDEKHVFCFFTWPKVIYAGDFLFI